MEYYTCILSALNAKNNTVTQKGSKLYNYDHWCNKNSQATFDTKLQLKDKYDKIMILVIFLTMVSGLDQEHTVKMALL